MKFEEISPGVSEEKSFKGVDGKTDGRTTDEEWSQKLILSLRLRWAKNYICNKLLKFKQK